LTERKTKQSKAYASNRLVGLVTGKIITSSNSLITSKVNFSNEKILKVFDKVSDKFDLVRNWAVIRELMTLPVAIISSL